MSVSRRNILKEKLVKALNESDPLVEFQLGFNMEFDRKYPPGSDKKTTIDQVKSLNTSLVHDCQTKQRLLEYTKFECDKEKKDSFEVTFYEAFSPYLILGDKKKAELLTRKPLLQTQVPLGVHQMQHDLKLTYKCGLDEWEVLSSLNSTL